MNKAIERTREAVGKTGKIGVFWHTQGSGKSLSMVFYAHKLQTMLDSPTIVVITDRNDLDEQLFTQFSKCRNFLRQIPMQAKSREDLKSLLRGREANGRIFTTMQKFEESSEPLSMRSNIIVMADEAHRGQYGFEEKVNVETGRVSVGAARRIRDSLPNASYIGFTGTPISSKDRNTREVFGDYIDIYDMTQAVADDATRLVYYESRVVNLNLDPKVLKTLDDEFELLEKEGATSEQIERSKREFSHLEEILGAQETNPDIKETAFKKFREKLEVCQGLMYGYCYSGFKNGTDFDRAQLIKGAVNFLMAPDKSSKRTSYMKEASLLHNSVTLCRSLLDENQRYEASFFEAVRTLLSRLQSKGKISKVNLHQRIAQQ